MRGKKNKSLNRKNKSQEKKVEDRGAKEDILQQKFSFDNLLKHNRGRRIDPAKKQDPLHKNQSFDITIDDKKQNQLKMDFN